MTLSATITPQTKITSRPSQIPQTLQSPWALGERVVDLHGVERVLRSGLIPYRISDKDHAEPSWPTREFCLFYRRLDDDDDMGRYDSEPSLALYVNGALVFEVLNPTPESDDLSGVVNYLFAHTPKSALLPLIASIANYQLHCGWVAPAELPIVPALEHIRPRP